MDNSKVIFSLGYNCNPKLLANKHNNNVATNLFDYWGSSMWGINCFLKDLFVDTENLTGIKCLFDKDNYEMKKHVRHLPLLKTDKTYNFRSLRNNFELEQTKRRINRMLSTLQQAIEADQTVYFLRVKEQNQYRTYDHPKAQPEQQELVKFCDLISMKYPQLKFKVVCLCPGENLNSKDKRVRYIKGNIPLFKAEERQNEMLKQILA